MTNWDAFVMEHEDLDEEDQEVFIEWLEDHKEDYSSLNQDQLNKHYDDYCREYGLREEE